MKTKTVYVCQSCGAEFPTWGGQCTTCGEWNTLVEEVRSGKSEVGGKRSEVGITNVETVKLSDVDKLTFNRVSTGIGELDRVLGGGLLPGQVVLLAGEPGIGKSTLLLQLANKIGGGVLYVAGEESPSQIASRAARLGSVSAGVVIIPETNVDQIIGEIGATREVGLIIIDSIQTMFTTDLNSSAGSLAQVRECAARLTTSAKKAGVPLILVGHVNKEGEVAGPKVLEHIVDTVLSFEGDPQHFYRLLRTTKNRFGAVWEVGVFQMVDSGLREVINPSDLFLGERLPGQSGSVVTATLEGARPMLVEIQALSSKTTFNYPRRAASGVNLNRLYLLLAVLERHASIRTSDKDIYVNVASGFKTDEPAVDLAICTAIASSVAEKPIDPKTVVFGEVGLSGEIRQVPQEERRSNEASKLGFTKVIGPKAAHSLRQALSLLM